MIKSKYIIVFIALLIVGMSVAVAADVDDSTSTPAKKVTKDTTKVVKNSAVTKKAIKAVDTKTTSKAKKTSEKVRNMTKKDDSKTVKVDVQVDETTSINKKLENNINDDISTVKEDTLNLSKKIIKNVKNDGENNKVENNFPVAADGIEYTEVDIDDEETFLKYFRYQEQGGVWLPTATLITGNTMYKLGYFPEKGKQLFFNTFMLQQHYDKHFSIVGKDGFTLNNIQINIQGMHCSISNINLIYNLGEEDQITPLIYCQDGGMAGDYIEFDNLNITVNCEIGTCDNIFDATQARISNVTFQNSIINAKVPASSFKVIEIRAPNTKILNNTINIEETYNTGNNPSIVAISGLLDTTLGYQSNNTICTDNTITMNGESTLTAIKLEDNTNTITNNNITVTTTGTATGVELTGNDNTVTDNTIIANDLAGDAAVVATGENNVVQGNGPIATELTVINPSVVNVNEISPMTVILKDAKGNLLANQEINVTVGDESETISTDSSGIAVYDFLPTTSGSADIVFNSISDGMFLSSNKTVTVTVNEDKDAIIEELNKTIQEQKETIASNEEDIEDLNNIINEQDDEIESLTNTTQALNNTIAQLEQDLTQAQEQLANNNNTNTNGTSNTNTTTPTKTSVTLKLNPTTIYTGSKTKITATLKDANGKAVASQKISIKVGTKTYTLKTNNKGVATKTVKVTKTGKNKVTATFKATNKYAKATKTSTLTVKAKEKTKITVTKLSYKNKKITIKATIKSGKKALTQNTKLTIKVDGKTLTAKKTSKKGKISLTLKKALKKGSHKIQIISKATSMYKQAKVTKTLKV